MKQKQEQTARYELGKIKALLRDRIINSTTALLMYVELKLAVGWTKKATAAEIYRELGIPKASFYRALSKLSATGWLEWTASDGTEFELARGPKSRASYSLKSETGSLKSETGSLKSETGSLKSETATDLKPLQKAASSDPPTFINSLSTSFQGTAAKELNSFAAVPTPIAEILRRIKLQKTN